MLPFSLHFGLKDLLPAEGQELPREPCRPFSCPLDIFQALTEGRILPRIPNRQFGISDDGGQKVVEIMRNPPCQGTDGLQFLGLDELGFQFLVLLLYFYDVQGKGDVPGS
jgi:hypothetical protein